MCHMKNFYILQWHRQGLEAPLDDSALDPALFKAASSTLSLQQQAAAIESALPVLVNPALRFDGYSAPGEWTLASAVLMDRNLNTRRLNRTELAQRKVTSTLVVKSLQVRLAWHQLACNTRCLDVKREAWCNADEALGSLPDVRRWV